MSAETITQCESKANGNAETEKPSGNLQSTGPKIIYPAYYDHSRKVYWVENARGCWIEVNETGLGRMLKSEGYPAKPTTELVSPKDRQIIRIQQENDVAYAGALAGYSKGLIEQYGNRILVTTSPKLIIPQKGEFPVLAALLENLFDDPKCDQRPYVFGWLKVALKSLESRRWRPGQALAIAGPPDSGKSLWQNLITLMLGGRAAKPYRYMSGATPFNSELFACEHLMIEDDVGSRDLRARREFGTRIKEFTVNETQSCHAKGRPAISLKPFWRVTITLNEEPENLLVLPPIDESVADKIILLKAHKRPMPMPTNTQEERNIFWTALVAELPAFICHLLHWEIPADLRSERFGVKHYHHPDLLDAIDDLVPEKRLLEMFDACFEHSENDETFRIKLKRPDEWEGTASELESMLVDSDSPVTFEARRLLNWHNATGTYLGHLARKFPQRVVPVRTAGSRRWRIIKAKTK
jgi:hypothetical protein